MQRLVGAHTHMQSFFGLGQTAEIRIELSDLEKHKKVDVRNEEGKKEKLPLYLDGESVAGKVGLLAILTNQQLDW